MSRNVRSYTVFKLSHQLVLKIYEITKRFPREERYGLSSQMRRSAYSIPMNLIEGGAKRGEKEFRRFVDISVGSCAETEYQLELVRDLKYIPEIDFKELKDQYEQVGKMLNSLMRKLSAKR